MAKIATVIEVKDYFGCDGRPVSAAEMQAFWSTLSAEEKLFYKNGVGEILEQQA
jgi:hypothetical protein